MWWQGVVCWLCISVEVCMQVQVCMCGSVYLCTFMYCLCIYAYIYICLHAIIYVCIYACMQFMYVCMCSSIRLSQMKTISTHETVWVCVKISGGNINHTWQLVWDLANTKHFQQLGWNPMGSESPSCASNNQAGAISADYILLLDARVCPSTGMTCLVKFPHLVRDWKRHKWMVYGFPEFWAR